MEILRKKGDAALALQRGNVPVEEVTELSFTECCLPFDRLVPITHLQKLTMVCMKPQLKDIGGFPFTAPLAMTIRRIDLSDNKIVALDAAIFKLPALTHLILSNNMIEAATSVTDAICAGCPLLKHLDVEDNPVKKALLRAEKEQQAEGGDAKPKGYLYREAFFGPIKCLATLDGYDANGDDADISESDEDGDDEYEESDVFEEDEEDEEVEEDAESDCEGQPAKKAARPE